MKHPKTCNGCKAFYQSQYHYSCDLGYNLKVERIVSCKGLEILRHSPAGGQCPKPITYHELSSAAFSTWSQ